MHQHLGELYTVALATRQHAHFLLLVGAQKIESGNVRARVQLAFAKRDVVIAATDFLPHRFFAVECIAHLFHVAKRHGLANRYRAGIGLVQSGQHAQ